MMNSGIIKPSNKMKLKLEDFLEPIPTQKPVK